MLRAVILGVAGAAAAALSATCAAGYAKMTLLPTQHRSDVYPVSTVPAFLPPGALREARETCASYMFTVAADGTPRNVEVWASFPGDAGEFARAGQAALEKWKFHPHTVNGRAFATDDVFFVMTYLVHHVESKQDENRVLGSHIPGRTTQVISTARDTLMWLCSQPPLHGVAIVAGGAAPAAGSAAAAARDTVRNPVVQVPADTLPANARPGTVRIRFCVDEQGRVADTVVYRSSPRGFYDEAARQALAATQFTPRKVNGETNVTCGLTVRAKFSGGSGGDVGRLDDLTFNELSGTLSLPKLRAQKAVQLSLKIPAGTPLPKVAKVEVRLCIEKDGEVSQASVVQADPPQYFDRAALDTVAGWRFAKIPRPMCDVYEWVRFPLGGS